MALDGRADWLTEVTFGHRLELQTLHTLKTASIFSFLSVNVYNVTPGIPTHSMPPATPTDGYLQAPPCCPWSVSSESTTTT